VRGQLAAISSTPALPAPVVRRAPVTRISKRRRWPMLLLGVTVALGALSLSYHSKQPRALYAYLHQRGWDVRIEHSVKNTSKQLSYATDKFITAPIHRLVDKTRKR
jgi:hypothetical protein